MKDQIHIGENTGTTDTHVLIIELKPGNEKGRDSTKSPALEKKWEEKEKKETGK